MAKALLGVVVAGCLVITWSSGFVGSVLGARAAPVDSLLMWRSLVSALLVGGWVLARRERVSLCGLVRQVGIGLLVQVVYLSCVFAAAAVGVPAGTTALVDALQPMLIAAAGSLLFGDQAARRQIIGLLLGATGAAVVVGGNVFGGHASVWGYLLPLGALIGLGSGTMLDRKWHPQESVSMALAIHCCTAAVVFSVLAISRGDGTMPVTGSCVFAIAWLVVSLAGGYGFYLLVVRRSGATHASTLLYLVPPVTAVWAWLMLSQPLGAATMVGMAITAVGVALASRQKPSISAQAAEEHSVVAV